MTMLSAEQGTQFQEQGYLLLPGLLNQVDFDGLIGRIEQAVDRKSRELQAEGKIAGLHKESPFKLRWQHIVEEMGQEQVRRSWDDDLLSPELFTLMSHPALLDVFESLIGPEIIATGAIAIRPKIPCDKRTTVLWHQDSHYYGEDAADKTILTIWIPLVDTDITNGCMQMIPGSHQWGYQPCEWDLDHKAHRPVNDPTERGEPVACEMKVGDVLIFNNLIFHRSLMNNSDHTRWSIDLRYLDPKVSFEHLKDFMPGFLARSRKDPEAVDTWESWQENLKPFLSQQASA